MYKQKKLKLNNKKIDSSSSESELAMSDGETDEVNMLDITVVVGDYVKVLYDGCEYPGIFLEIAEEKVKAIWKLVALRPGVGLLKKTSFGILKMKF